MITKIRRHLSNWLELYFWVPLAFVAIFGLIHFAHYLTGRPPTESADFLVALGFRLLSCVFIVVLLSLTREATGHWFTKAEIKDRPVLAWPPMIATVAFAIIYAYILLH